MIKIDEFKSISEQLRNLNVKISNRNGFYVKKVEPFLIQLIFSLRIGRIFHI